MTMLCRASIAAAKGRSLAEEEEGIKEYEVEVQAKVRNALEKLEMVTTTDKWMDVWWLL